MVYSLISTYHFTHEPELFRVSPCCCLCHDQMLDMMNINAKLSEVIITSGTITTDFIFDGSVEAPSHPDGFTLIIRQTIIHSYSRLAIAALACMIASSRWVNASDCSRLGGVEVAISCASV